MTYEDTQWTVVPVCKFRGQQRRPDWGVWIRVDPELLRQAGASRNLSQYLHSVASELNLEVGAVVCPSSVIQILEKKGTKGKSYSRVGVAELL